MSSIKENFRQYAIFIALIFIAILFQILTNGILFMPANITNLILQNSHVLILAIGMTLVIVIGKIDLSVGSVLGLSSALSGAFIINMGLPVWFSIIAVLFIGGCIGAWQGFWIAYKNVPFFVVTLAGMMIFRSLTMVILGGRMLSPLPTHFQIMAAGFVPDVLYGSAYNVTAIVVCAILAMILIIMEIVKRRSAKKLDLEVASFPLFVLKIIVMVAVISLFAYWFSASNGIPNVLVVLSALILIYSYITLRTITGRHIYATGRNEKASYLSGIKTKKIIFWVYVNMGFLAALAGLVFTARLNAAMPRAGDGAELQAIAAAFIGGASPSGGVGKVSGAIAGVLIVGILENGLNILGVSEDIRQVAIGLVLLAAVIFDVLVKSRVAKKAKIKG